MCWVAMPNVLIVFTYIRVCMYIYTHTCANTHTHTYTCMKKYPEAPKRAVRREKRSVGRTFSSKSEQNWGIGRSDTSWNIDAVKRLQVVKKKKTLETQVLQFAWTFMRLHLFIIPVCFDIQRWALTIRAARRRTNTQQLLGRTFPVAHANTPKQNIHGSMTSQNNLFF